MRGARDPHERPGARQLAGEPLAEADEVLDVVGADDHEGRDADLAEPARDGRVGLLELGVDARLGLERGALHGGDEVDHGRVDVAVAARDPHPDVGLHRRRDVARLERRLLLGAEGRELVGLGELVEGRVEQHEPGDALRGAQREVERDEPAERRGDDRHPVEPELVEQGDQGAGIRDDPGLERRAPEARQVGRDRPVPGGGEALGQRLPHAAVGDARVHQQDRGPVAADLVVQRHAFAASWPQAASMSRPRVRRTVARSPCSSSTARNASIA